MRRRWFSRFKMSSTGHRLDTRASYTCEMAQHDDSDRQAWLDALNALVQMGLVEVVAIAQDGEPSYRLASRIRDVRIVSRSYQ